MSNPFERELNRLQSGGDANAAIGDRVGHANVEDRAGLRERGRQMLLKPARKFGSDQQG